MYDIDRLIFRLYIHSIMIYYDVFLMDYPSSEDVNTMPMAWSYHSPSDRYFLYRYSRIMMPYNLIVIYIYICILYIY